MAERDSPLLFPSILNAPGLWKELGKIHHLSDKDFRWLRHTELATAARRLAQTPPMKAQRILLKLTSEITVPLAGSFVLGDTPDDNGVVLYTPYDGVKKYVSLALLQEALQKRLADASEDDDLLAFLSLAQRQQLLVTPDVTLVYQEIAGDVFDDQRTAIEHAQRLNAAAIIKEIKQLPSLTSLVDKALGDLLKSEFAGLRHVHVRVAFYSIANNGEGDPAAPAKHWHESISPRDAVLLVYRHQRWPSGQKHEFFVAGNKPADDQEKWTLLIRTAANKLPALLFRQLEAFWDAASETGAPRREMFAQVLQDQARAELLLKREANIIDAGQFDTLHRLIRPAAPTAHQPTFETVHLWEYQPNAVELAGSLMISHEKAFLYTPAQGLQVLKDYADLKDTLLSKFRAAGHEDELYSLLSLEERARFLGFDRPHVSGEIIGGDIFRVLLEKIITKQRQNIEYALQVFRQSDGAVDIYALMDKSLDIRPMLHERVCTTDTDGRWSTRPVYSTGQLPSRVQAEKAAEAIKTFNDVEAPLRTEFDAQPMTSVEAQRTYLETLKPRLAHALFVGLRGEARFATRSGALTARDKALVDGVFNADQPSRKTRAGLNGFWPDAYSLTLECEGVTDLLPLAHCAVLTERGGLDPVHSGRVVLWTPAVGLEAFANINQAREELRRRLLDSQQRLTLLENLPPAQHWHHRRYSLGPLRMIEDNVLHHCAQSAIDLFLARCEHLRSLNNDPVRQQAALRLLRKDFIETNLRRSADYARAFNRQQSLPAWLGMASRDEQQLHIELLEQWANSVVDDKDYLHGIKPLAEYVQETLKTLLDQRFPGSKLDPQHIAITPNLALAGPARDLTTFALNHINVAQGTGFKVSSLNSTALPAGLDQQAVKQLLLSLAIPTTYSQTVLNLLSANNGLGKARRQRFSRQLPWQLLQHAHALKLQQHLTGAAFDLLRQVLDMPDALARATVAGANAIVYPLSLIKTAGAAAVTALGLYLIAPGKREKGPRVLYAPYAEQVFHEFESDSSLIAALNKPGALQDLLVRRLPDTERAIFRSLWQSSVGQSSEITLSIKALTGNFLQTLYSDNLVLLKQMLGTQDQQESPAEWAAATHLFSRGIKQVASLLPGKLGYVTFLWQAYKDFKGSADALQDHHWKRALKAFIAGTVQMLTVGRLSLEEQAQAARTAPAQNPTELPSPTWKDIHTTSPLRTGRQSFESFEVALKDLAFSRNEGIYTHAASKHTYAPIEGKVYRIEKPAAVWQLTGNEQSGPSLWKNATTLVLDPDRHSVHYGKVLTKMYNRYANTREARLVLNIEARGMEAIRRQHPEKARMLVQAVDLARFYAFNTLHNLALFKNGQSGPRLGTFLKRFFDIDTLDAEVLAKVKKAIEPICKTLVDPGDDLMNTERFIIGSNKYRQSQLIAFVLDDDLERNVHFTESFFDQQLDAYKTALTEPFNVDGHAQAATLIHEFAHQVGNAVDIATLEARRPFADLIDTVSGFGTAMKHRQQTFQREALSLDTPREELFSRWSYSLQKWVSLDEISGMSLISEEILKTTLSPDIETARDAFYDPQTAQARIDTILRNADSIAFMVCELGRQLDPVVTATATSP